MFKAFEHAIHLVTHGRKDILRTKHSPCRETFAISVFAIVYFYAWNDRACVRADCSYSAYVDDVLIQRKRPRRNAKVVEIAYAPPIRMPAVSTRASTQHDLEGRA